MHAKECMLRNCSCSLAAGLRGSVRASNQLLDYLKCLSPVKCLLPADIWRGLHFAYMTLAVPPHLSQEELLALTDCASEDVLEAMNQFVTRLMGESVLDLIHLGWANCGGQGP